MKNCKKKIEEYINNGVIHWENGHYVRAILHFLIPILVIALLTALIAKTVVAVTTFLRFHYTQLVVAGLVLWGFVGWLDGHKERRWKLHVEEEQERERKVRAAQREYAATKDSTYVMQAQLLFSVVRSLGSLGIVPPTRLSDIYSPCRTIPKMNGAVILCQFLLQKDGEEVDLDLLQRMLQTKIDQRLSTGEFPGISAKFVYDGRSYSGLCIDSVHDSEGYVEVYTVLVNDAYCLYRQDRDLTADIYTPPIDRRDIDY